MTRIIDYCSFAPSYPVARYVLRMWSISFPATVILGLLVMTVSSTKPAGHTAHAALAAFSTVVLVPIIETLLLAAAVLLLRRLRDQRGEDHAGQLDERCRREDSELVRIGPPVLCLHRRCGQ